jgi:hypothetical protein
VVTAVKTKPTKWECPLDITAYYLDYPEWFVAYLKSRGYFGYWWRKP